MTLLTAVTVGVIIGLFLGALGGGGSILTVPALACLLGEPARAATAESLVIVGVTALIAAIMHARAGRVRWAAGLVFGGIGVAASYAGTAANRAVNPQVLLLAFAGLMTVAAVAMLARKRGQTSAEPQPAAESAPLAAASMGGGVAVLETSSIAQGTRLGRLLAAALAVGFLTGFLGVGGGFVIVPALVMVLGFPMPVAVGTSLVVIAINSAGALAARAGDATLHWAVVLPFALAAVASSMLGKQIADKVRPELLTRAFAILLFAVAAYVAITNVSALRA